MNVARAPCATVLASRRRFGVCTCVSMFSIMTGLTILFFLVCVPFSGLVICTSLRAVINLVITVACHVCYLHGFGRARFSGRFSGGLYGRVAIFSK